MQKEKKTIFKPLAGLPNLGHNLLFYLAGLLALFIPLYPKLPLVDILPGYIVRLRLEDLLIVITLLVFGVKVRREKIKLRSNPIFPLMTVYFIAGFLSILSGMFLVKSIPLQALHVAKAFLHLARRIEYMSLFFIFYYAVENMRQLKTMLMLVALAVFGVTVYGYGQKYMLWPVFSTMNREFAKGVKLYLMEHGRVSSTFGGHYDLAAYVLITSTLLLAMALLLKNKLLSLSAWLLFLLEYWLLILTVSRASFIGYMVALTVLFFLLAFRKKFFWAFWRWGLVMFFTLTVMFFFGDLSDRFAQLLGIDSFRKNIREQVEQIGKKPSPDEVVAVVSSDIMPSLEKQIVVENVNDKSGRPIDVISEPVIIEATQSGEATYSYTMRYPTYSENALKYGLSTAIRLDALWPRAIAAFWENPILGSGYSTLTKENAGEFTYAESTDNDYLRMLGETGLFGTLSFLGLIVFLIYKFARTLKSSKDSFMLAFMAAGIAICSGLLVNAFYIDVFEASKVAYTFWALLGLILVAIKLEKAKKA